MNQGSILGGPNSMLVLGGAVALLSIPSAILGFSAGFDPARVAASAQSGLDSLSEDVLDPADARTVMLRSLTRTSRGSDLFNVTPGRGEPGSRRANAVAVRLDAATARALQVRSAADAAGTASPMRMSQTAYNLTLPRGTKGLADGAVGLARPADQPLADLQAFKLSPGAKEDSSRFSTRLQIDEQQSAGRAPRTFTGDGEAMVDVGGSYRLSSSVAVTAGVRYTQADRERLVPITGGLKDDQAVYVGTRLKF
ncbi:hypothetical protein T8S45_12715 [Blastomonas marina]|nr:hypothetical protein [Blastomonas marina]WPZ03678.1 hypothetical protein T8S45_12715 [Blastomonas marina]